MATPQRKTYTVTFATLILVVLLVFFAIRPAIISIFNRTSENGTKEEVLTKMDKKYESLLGLSTQKDEKAEELTLLDSSMPASREEDFLIANIQQIIQENNIEFVNLSIEKNIQKSILDNSQLGVNTSTSGFTLTIRGRRSSIIKLVGELESFPRIINIYTISFSDAGGQFLNTDTVNAVIEAEFYYYDTNAENLD